MKRTGFMIMLGAVLMMPWPCMLGAAVSNNDAVPSNYVKPGILAVMPLLTGKFHANMDEIVEKTISCTIGQLCFTPDDIKLGAGTRMTNLVRDTVSVRLEPASLIPADRSEEAYRRLSADENKDALRSLAQRFGKDLQADFVLIGTIWRYRDRSEQEEDIQRQASVAFVVYLVDVKTGKRVWTGHYDKSQGALTEDLSNAPLFFKGGAKWLTAEEIAKIAVKDTFENFPFDLINGVSE